MNPYIPYELDELTVLKSVKNWTNTRVRVFGKVGESIHQAPGSALELRYLHSVGEEKPSNIVVNFSLISEILNRNFDEGSVVQILGDLQIFDTIIGGIRYSFVVNAHIIRDFSKVDPTLYHKASALQSVACPKEFFLGASKNSCEEELEDFFLSDNEVEVKCKKLKNESWNAKSSNDKEDIPSTVHMNTDHHTNDSSIDMFADSD